jgi:hypothetical protein
MVHHTRKGQAYELPAPLANLLSFDATTAYEAGFLFRAAEADRPVQRLKRDGRTSYLPIHEHPPAHTIFHRQSFGLAVIPGTNSGSLSGVPSSAGVRDGINRAGPHNIGGTPSSAELE